jgi:hypothetical protein
MHAVCPVALRRLEELSTIINYLKAHYEII